MAKPKCCEKRREAMRERVRKLRENPEYRAKERALDRVRRRQRREKMTTEERARLRTANRERAGKKRLSNARMGTQIASALRTKDAQRKRQFRQNLTDAERAIYRARDAERKRLKRAEKKRLCVSSDAPVQPTNAVPVSPHFSAEETKDEPSSQTDKSLQELSQTQSECVRKQFSPILSIQPVPPVKMTRESESSVDACLCNPHDEHPCGDLDCLNRATSYECDPENCPAKERCENRMFSRGVSPKLEILSTEKRGFVLVSREGIAEGSFITEFVGELINDAEFKRRLQQKENSGDENYYFFFYKKGLIIDSERKGNLSRFLSHSCDPNCESQKWIVKGQLRIGLFALKNIPSNTELTLNYNWNKMGPLRRECHCESDKCTGYIDGKYTEKSKKNNQD